MKKILIILAILNLSYADICIITDNNAILYKDSTSNKTISLNNQFGLIGKKGVTSGTRVQIGINKNVVLWINPNNIVCSQNTSYLQAEKVIIKNAEGKEIKTQISKKIFIVNDIQDNSAIVNVPYYSSPNMSEEKGTIKIYEIYFLFDQKTINNKTMYLLAKRSKVNLESSGSILGWVDSKYAKQWNSRLAAETKGGAKIYRSDQFNPQQILFSEPSDKTFNYETMRYPILEKTGKEEYKINFMADNKEYSKVIDIGGGILQQRDAYIIFLLDATAGMSQYINNVKNGISDFIRETPNPKLRIAVAIYRDYVDTVSYNLMTDGFVEPNEALRTLDDINATSSRQDNISYIMQQEGRGHEYARDKSKLEAVFNGIKSVINEEKLHLDHLAVPANLVLIGDHGNHIEDENNLTAIKIAKELKKKKVILRAIRVHYDTSLRRYSNLFSSQMNDIISSMDNLGSLLIDNNGSRKSIKNNINTLYQELNTLKREIISGNIGGNISCFNIKLLKLMGVPTDKIGKSQQSSSGYIRKKDFKDVILAKKRDIKRIVSQFDTMAEEILFYKGGAEAKEDLVDAMTKTIKALTGDKITSEDNIISFIENRLVIPIRSELLNRSFRDLISEIDRDPEYRIRLGKVLYQKSIYLDALVNEREITSIDWIQEDSEYNIVFKKESNGAMKRKRTLHNISMSSSMTGNDVEGNWLWVPVKYLP